MSVSGWIILDKPKDVFSRKADTMVAHLFGAETYGHIGTLDKMASGVLPIALGKATKMIPFVENIASKTKEYLFSIQFGFETDTLDITGQEINRTNKIPVEKKVLSVLPRLVGDIEQTPPAYSAIHIQGHRAYNLARKGKVPSMPARKVHIEHLEFLGRKNNSWNFKVICSRGTYVRSIARDIAKLCGTLAVVDMIQRTKSTGFDVKDSVKLDFLKNLVNNGADFKKFLKPIDFGLGGIPVLDLADRSAKIYQNGGFVRVDAINGLWRVYHESKFLGIGIVQNELLHPKRNID